MKNKLGELNSTASCNQIDHNILSMIHDIRTPLMVIQNCTDLLLNNEYSAQAFKMILQSYKRMGSILCQASNSHLQLNGMVKGLDDCVAELISESAAIKKSERKIHYSHNIADSHVVAEHVEKLQRVLSNLIDNALESTNQDLCIKINGYYNNVERTYFLTVTDDGPGIEDHVVRNFEMNVPSTTKKSGHGLGLHGAKKIIQSMGGEMKINRVEGKTGTLVSISIPKF